MITSLDMPTRKHNFFVDNYIFIIFIIVAAIPLVFGFEMLLDGIRMLILTSITLTILDKVEPYTQSHERLLDQLDNEDDTSFIFKQLNEW